MLEEHKPFCLLTSSFWCHLIVAGFSIASCVALPGTVVFRVLMGLGVLCGASEGFLKCDKPEPAMSCPGGSCKNQWAAGPSTAWDFQSDRLDLTFVTDGKFCEIDRTACSVLSSLNLVQPGEVPVPLGFSAFWMISVGGAEQIRYQAGPPGQTGPPPAQGPAPQLSWASPGAATYTRVTRPGALVTGPRTLSLCSRLSPILHLGLRQRLMNNKPTQIGGFSGFPECFQIFLLSNRMCGIQQDTVLNAVIFNQRQYSLLS